jgi:hypothetical protein
MTQATTSPFELSLAVNDFESAVGLVCGAADALWHYAQFSHDNTLHYLIDMECTHAGTLRERLYAERPLGPFERSITVNEMEKPICDVYDGAYALWDYVQDLDDTLACLTGMLCDHATALRAIFYPDETEARGSKQLPPAPHRRTSVLIPMLGVADDSGKVDQTKAGVLEVTL